MKRLRFSVEENMRCPVCRADHNQEATCRRCRADLSLLLSLEKHRQEVLARAIQALQAGHGKAVLVHAQKAHDLRRDASSWRLLALGQLLMRNFAEARRCYLSGADQENG